MAKRSELNAYRTNVISFICNNSALLSDSCFVNCKARCGNDYHREL